MGRYKDPLDSQGLFVGCAAKLLEPNRHLRGSCTRFSPPEVDRTWDIWGSYYNIPKAILYLRKGDYNNLNSRHLHKW